MEGSWGQNQVLKPCLLRRNHSREQHGVAASCLEDLRSKAYDILAIDKSLAPITLVLAEDGTIVDDDDYFLCLPSNTKFVALAGNEKWAYSNSDGGTAWISQESVDMDETDSGAGLKWKNVAKQLKEDLSSIVLLSEEDLQESWDKIVCAGPKKYEPSLALCLACRSLHWDLVVLIDAPCSDLARELCQSCATVRGLQNTLQQALDQREEARQSKQLLALYLQALEKEGGVLAKQREARAGSGDELDAVGTGTSGASSPESALSGPVLAVLKEKPAPELSLSSRDLELVAEEAPRALAAALSWDVGRTDAVQRACREELGLRLQQVQSLQALRSISAGRSPPPREPQRPKRARRDPV